VKFNLAWANIVKENSILKYTVLVLGAVTILLTICFTEMGLKNPLVIERGCLSTIVPLADTHHTNAEIESFLEVALQQRFDSRSNVETFLSGSERELKTKEQKDLQTKKLTQKISINKVLVAESGVTVDADRLISVGEIRSAFRFPLIVNVESVGRTVANPFGLILTDVKSADAKEKK
jgi:hypothetical protein